MDQEGKEKKKIGERKNRLGEEKKKKRLFLSSNRLSRSVHRKGGEGECSLKPGVGNVSLINVRARK
jgi:hypothetical protein